MLALIYINRALEMSSFGILKLLDLETLVAVSICVAIKFLEDRSFASKCFAEAIGRSTAEFYDAEIEFLTTLGFGLVVRREELIETCEGIQRFVQEEEQSLLLPADDFDFYLQSQLAEASPRPVS